MVIGGMRLLHRRFTITNGLILLAVLSLVLSVVKSEEGKKKEEEYDYKPPGYPGSDTSTGENILKLIQIEIFYEYFGYIITNQ